MDKLDAIYTHGAFDRVRGRERKPSKYDENGNLLGEEHMSDAEVDAYYRGWCAANRSLTK